MDEPIDVLYED